MATRIFSQRYRSPQSGDDGGGKRSVFDPRDGQPFSSLNLPRGDDSYIEHCGTPAALKRYGLLVPFEPAVIPFEEPITIKGADGHDWEVWRNDVIFTTARRRRTPAEREAWIDEQNARTFNQFFSSDRVRITRFIAVEVMAQAERLQRPRRGDHRRVRRVLGVLGEVQWKLTSRTKVDMREVHNQLASVGLVVPVTLLS